MIIYKITNIVSGKCYIGQTIHSFNKRYRGGKWWQYTDNPMLRNSYNKHGPERFVVEILETNVPSIEELNRLEAFYAEKYNAYSPNGYNLRGCGDNKFSLPETVEKSRLGSLKTRYARDMNTWEVVEIKDLVRFCQEKNLSYHSMYSLIKGGRDIITCGNYCSIHKTKEEIDGRQKIKFKNEPVHLVDSEGQTLYVENPRDFAEKNNLEKGSFYKLLHGEMLYYRGYRLPENVGKYPKSMRKIVMCKNFGEPEEFVSIISFCNEKNLSKSSIAKVLKGTLKMHRGWHLPTLTEEELFMVKKRSKITTELLDPDGRLVRIDNLAFFCHKNNFNYDSFYCLNKGVSRSCFGWTRKGMDHLYDTYISPEGVAYKSIDAARIAKEFNLNKSCLMNARNPNSSTRSHLGWTVLRFEMASQKTFDPEKLGFFSEYILP